VVCSHFIYHFCYVVNTFILNLPTMPLNFCAIFSFWVQMSSNEPKLLSKCQFFCNSCYICLCVAILMACESWKVGFIE
jgi:hypothetical protein